MNVSPRQEKYFLINAIEIDVSGKLIKEIKIENAMSAISQKLGFQKYSEVFIGEAMACLITGSEDNPNKNHYFEINGIPQKFYNSGIVVRIPKNYNMERLLKCNITLEGVRNMVKFND